MSAYVFWQRGLRGPVIAKVYSKTLSALDIQTKLSDPVELKPDEEKLCLDDLAQRYHRPQPTKEPPT